MDIITLDLEPLNFSGDIAAYLLLTDKYYLLIEVGPKLTFKKLLEKMEYDIGVKPREIDYVLVTHIHLDHAGAAGYIIRYMDKAKIFVHPRGYPHLINPSKLWQSSRDVLGNLAEVYGEPIPISRNKLVNVDDKTTLDIDEDTVLFIHTPGHASHHMVIYLVENKTLFSGDALGLYHNNILVPNTPKPHKYDDAVASLKKLNTLKINYVYFTHFGGSKSGNEMVKRALEKWKLWYNILWASYEKDELFSDAYSRLVSLDKDAALIDKYFKSRPYGNDELIINVKGFMEYFKWKYEGS